MKSITGGRRRMPKEFLVILYFIIGTLPCIQAQELYPNSEPASTIPKGALGIRAMSETFNEYGELRNQFALRIMYGLGSKLTVYAEPVIGNHHGDFLPPDLLTHTHPSSGSSAYSLNAKTWGVPYPYKFGGVYGYAKYRFFTKDGHQTHLRMAAYLEGSTSDVPHDEAEPGLVGDTKGYGGGIIVTQLLHRFAATLRVGGVIPGAHNETTLDVHSYYSPEPVYLHTSIFYGRAAVYNLSFGYLLYPSQYRDYKQLNLNVYLEFIGSAYEEATVIQNGVTMEAQTPTLKKGNYITGLPGIQAIINSNTRIDFSMAFDLVNRSYRYFTPVYLVGVQHYFYFNKSN